MLYVCQLASKLFYLGERREPCKNAQASGEAARGLSLPRFRISSPVSTFYDIPQIQSFLAGQLFVDFFFSFQLPAAVGEAPTFGFTENMANKFFKPEGVRSLTITYMTVVFYLFWQPKYFLLLDIIFAFHWEI